MSEVININRPKGSWKNLDESSVAQLEKLNHYIIHAVEQERARLSIKVHDELGQLLTALKFGLHRLITTDSIHENFNSSVQELIASTNEIVHKVQHISQEMHPDILRKLGLFAAIDWYCKDFEKRTDIACTANLPEDYSVGMDEFTELSLYRVLQEAMTNILRHANASQVNINFYRLRKSFVLEIVDNGIGMPPEKINSCESMGLISMQQRIKNCRGKLVFENQRSGGLKISISVPYHS